MSIPVSIEQPTNHALVLSVVFRSLSLEELDTLLAQGDGDFDAFLLKRKFIGGRQEVGNHLSPGWKGCRQNVQYACRALR